MIFYRSLYILLGVLGPLRANINFNEIEWNMSFTNYIHLTRISTQQPPDPQIHEDN